MEIVVVIFTQLPFCLAYFNMELPLEHLKSDIQTSMQLEIMPTNTKLIRIAFIWCLCLVQMLSRFVNYEIIWGT